MKTFLPTLFFISSMTMLNEQSFAVNLKFPEIKILPCATVSVQTLFVMNTTCLQTAQAQQSVMYAYSNQQFNSCINTGGLPSGCYTAQQNYENATTGWIINQLNYCEGYREI